MINPQLNPKVIFDLQKDINNLSEKFDKLMHLPDQVDQLRVDFDSLHDAIPVNANVWLKPSELSALLKISNSTVTKWRNEGLFKKTSVKEVVRGKRTDFYYHRINAVKDISTKRPIQINTNKRILDRFS